MLSLRSNIGDSMATLQMSTNILKCFLAFWKVIYLFLKAGLVFKQIISIPPVNLISMHQYDRHKLIV